MPWRWRTYSDAHVNYLHRDNIQDAADCSSGLLPRASGCGVDRVARWSPRPAGFAVRRSAEAAPWHPPHDFYPNGWKWPKHRFRRWWAWLFLPLFSLTRVPAPPSVDPELWGHDLHLPGMARVGALKTPGQRRFHFGGGGFMGKMTRQVIAVEPDLTRLWYFHYTRPSNWLQRTWYKLLYNLFYRWAGELGFSAQDSSVMPNQRWDTKEMLSSTDFGVVQWRKLVITKHFGGRNAKFGDQKASAVASHVQPTVETTHA